MKKKHIQAINKGREDVFYNSWTWQKVRDRVKERDNYECQMCKEDGRVGRGDTVHHIKHLKDRPDLGVDEDNLITLCYEHHNAVHPEKWGQGNYEEGFTNEERW